MTAVFLDRDGVLNRSIVIDGVPTPPATVAELEILTEAREACAELRNAGFKLICVTNQPDIGRGLTTKEEVGRINSAIRHELGLDDILLCSHDDSDNCDCRKPRPGMLLQAAEAYGLKLDQCYLIGDRWRDIGAGNSAGCFTIFVDRGYAERNFEPADHTTHCTLEAARWIIRHYENCYGES